MRDLIGKVAFVTGAASGIGLAIARALARAGMKVAMTDLDEARLGQARGQVAASGGAVHTGPLDVSDYDAWQGAVASAEQALGPIALLVNNAGIGGGGNVADENPARWRKVLEINTLGTFYGCRTVLPRLLEGGQEAHIVNVASLSGLRSNPGMSSYDASKFAVVGLSDALRLELQGTKVGLSVVYPGMTRTKFVEHSQEVIAKATGAAPSAGSGVGNILAGGMDPDKLADRVVRGVQAGEYHIFTHVDHKPMIEAVFNDRLAAFGENADPDYSEDISALQARIAHTQASPVGG